jgi:hypothetical protein
MKERRKADTRPVTTPPMKYATVPTYGCALCKGVIRGIVRVEEHHPASHTLPLMPPMVKAGSCREVSSRCRSGEVGF